MTNIFTQILSPIVSITSVIDKGCKYLEENLEIQTVDTSCNLLEVKETSINKSIANIVNINTETISSLDTDDKVAMFNEYARRFNIPEITST